MEAKSDKRKFSKDTGSDQSDRSIIQKPKRPRIDGSPPKNPESPTRRILQSPTPEELSLLNEPIDDNSGKIIQKFKFPHTISSAEIKKSSTENQAVKDPDSRLDEFFSEIRRREESSQKRLKNPDLHSKSLEPTKVDSVSFGSDKDFGDSSGKLKHLSSTANSDLAASHESVS